MPTHPAPSVAFPGIPAVVDGSEASASVETRISEMVCAAVPGGEDVPARRPAPTLAEVAR